MKTSVTREGVYYVVIVLLVLFGAMLREVNAMLLFGAFLCAPLFIAWRLGRKSLRGITVKRTLPQHIFAGEAFSITLEAEKTVKKKSLACWGLIAVDRILPLRVNGNEAKNVKPYEPAVYFEKLANNVPCKKKYSGYLPQRGRYRAGFVKIQTRFPFGFFLHHFEQKDPSVEFCVYPKLGKLSPNWRLRQHQAMESRLHHRFTPSRVTGEFFGLRHWQQGDMKKWILWRASAKHNQPVVRQFEQYQNQDFAVVLDLYHSGVIDEKLYENFELAVSFSATLISSSIGRSGSNLFFATSSPTEDFLCGTICTLLIDNILYRLAVAEAAQEDALPEVLLKTMTQLDRNAELILVSPQEIDLTSPRFRSIQNDPLFRAVLQRTRFVNTANEDLEAIYTV